MRQFICQGTRWGGVILVVVLLAALLSQASPEQVVAAGTTPTFGIICTTSTSPNPTFTLTAKEGYIILPDGNTIYMWGYAEGNNDFQYPGPILCVNEGDTVTIILNNTLPKDVSLIFPSQTNVLVNGAPAQPQFDGGGNLTSLTQVAPANGGSATYSFVASRPGTYAYESGTEPQIQVQMGLFGAIVVRPKLHPDWAYNRADTQFNPDAEFIQILSEIEPTLHEAVRRGEPFDMNNYHARYWLINGRGLPDTLAPNYASWLPAQPYSSVSRIHPFNDWAAPTDPAYNPYPALVRYLSFGTVDYPIHPHGKNGRVIARDGHLLQGPAGQDLTYELFSIPVGPGQTWDEEFVWKDVEHYDPVTNPVPVTIPREQNLSYGAYYSGSPYLGRQQMLPPGTITQNLCGEYYIISHNHNLVQIMAWDFVMMGQGTFTRVDPPLPNTCPDN